MKPAWYHILLSLAEDDRYGSAIQEAVRSATDGEVRLWPATLYGSLEELMERGWIRELDRSEHGEAVHGRERFYRITPEGKGALRGEVERLEGLARLGRLRLAGEEGSS